MLTTESEFSPLEDASLPWSKKIFHVWQYFSLKVQKGISVEFENIDGIKSDPDEVYLTQTEKHMTTNKA